MTSFSTVKKISSFKRQNKSKLRTLRFLKQTWNLEDYLLTVGNIADRTALCKFRLSDHSLMVEKGRHDNLNKSDRMCPFCPGQIENEFHFLLKCSTYTNLKKKPRCLDWSLQQQNSSDYGSDSLSVLEECKNRE